MILLYLMSWHQVITKDTATSGSGRGTVLQDIHATPDIVMEQIANLGNYHKVVPNGKLYEQNLPVVR